ncbi:hypothetical protein DFJ73DRAFT_769835 [Zopfochytrium polystomum]|nr:hypothetical protein DFJ73DRAFT_769835 [Zopfochytrium polystomum]
MSCDLQFAPINFKESIDATETGSAALTASIPKAPIKFKEPFARINFADTNSASMSRDPYSPMKLKDPVARLPAIPKAKCVLQFAPIKITDPAARLPTIPHDPVARFPYPFPDPNILFQEMFQALQFAPNHILGAGGVTDADDAHIHVEEINADNEIVCRECGLVDRNKLYEHTEKWRDDLTSTQMEAARVHRNIIYSFELFDKLRFDKRLTGTNEVTDTNVFEYLAPHLLAAHDKKLVAKVFILIKKTKYSTMCPYSIVRQMFCQFALFA